MNKRRIARRVVAAVGCLLLSSAASADIRDQLDVRTGRAELVVPGMTAHQVASAVQEALSSWGTPASTTMRSPQAPLPARPAAPTTEQRYLFGAPVVDYLCSDAYAEVVKRPPPVQNAFMFAAEATQACVFPFQQGVKIHLIFTSIKKTESLTSGLFNGITTAIRGKDADFMAKELESSIEEIRSELPTLLVERVEVPGMDVREPDIEAVAALMPAASATPATSESEGHTQATAKTSIAAKIEARKNLTAMGIVYHDTEQFADAIRRKDDVAVQLFVEAGGVDLDSPLANGQLPVDLANQIGATELAALLAPPASALGRAEAIAPAAPAIAAQTMVPEPIELPAEVLESIDAQLDAMNLEPAQRQAMRAEAIANLSAQVRSIKEFADRIDPNTGQLR